MPNVPVSVHNSLNRDIQCKLTKLLGVSHFEQNWSWYFLHTRLKCNKYHPIFIIMYYIKCKVKFYAGYSSV